MKRIFVFFLALTALLCFAMPAVASPPGGLPALEAVGPVAVLASGYVAQEAAPIVAVAPGLSLSSATSFASIALALRVSIIALLIVATVAMLAGLMREAQSSGNRLSFDPRRRLHALARDQTATA